MKFDPNAILVEGNRFTFPARMMLPPVCLHTGLTAAVEYTHEEFEYLPGTAPGGAMPIKRKATIQIPVNAMRLAKRKRTSNVLNCCGVLGLLFQLESLVHLGITAQLIVVVGQVLVSVFQAYWLRKEHCSFDPIECVKIEGRGNETRITLRLGSKPAQALKKYVEWCRARESKPARAFENRIASALRELRSARAPAELLHAHQLR